VAREQIRAVGALPMGITRESREYPKAADLRPVRPGYWTGAMQDSASGLPRTLIYRRLGEYNLVTAGTQNV
jgi:hypothetical protein